MRTSLAVREVGGHNLSASPVGGGVPLPKGLVSDVSQLALSSSGKPVASQAQVLSRWEDGSARWVFVDWQSDLRAQQISSVDLEIRTRTTTTTQPPQSVRLRETSEAVEVDTGPLQFRVPKKQMGLLDSVRLEGQPATSAPVTCFLRIGSQRNSCLAPASVKVLAAGPLRARVEIRGRYERGFVYVVRIEAYAGKSFVRLWHTFEQHFPEPFLDVQQIALDIPFAPARAKTYRFGVENKPALAGTLAEAGVVLAQTDNLDFSVAGEPTRGHAAGWAVLQGTGQGLALAARFFWQEYPKSIELRRDRIVYNLWAPTGAIAKLGSGAGKTHEVALYFSGRVGPDEAELAALANGPLLALAPPEWIANTGALRNALRPGNEGREFLKQLQGGYRRHRAYGERERWDDCGSATCAGLEERPRVGFFGMWNWGDWNFPGYHDTIKGCDAWGNLEYDTTQVLALAFAASGDPTYAESMVAAARHFMDVDTIHYSTQHPQWTGMNHPKNPLHFSFELGGTDLGHTWTEGLLSYYLLTGDERGLEIARGIADHLVARIRRGQVQGNPRQWGWPQIALVAMYEATGEEQYRRAALDFARGGMRAHAPNVIRDWKLGVLAESLAYTDSIAADPQIRDWLTRYAAALVAYSRVADPRFMPAIAYVGTVTNKADYQEVARKAVQRLTFGQWSKPFTIAGRVGFSTLASLSSPRRTVGSPPTH